MKQRFLKITGFILIIVMLFSIIGCSSATENKSSASNKAKTTEVKKKTENQAASENKQKNDQTAVPQTAAQQNTAAQATNPGTAAAASAGTTAQQKTVSTGPSSASAAPTQPKQSTSASTASTQQTAPTAPAESSTNQVPVQTVKITIIGPKDKGTILNGKTINIKTGDSVLDVLIAAVGKNNIDYSGSGATAYVRGIDNIYEFDYGPKSGWTVSQNGTRLTRSAGAIQVKAGDNIEWKYLEDYTVNN
jgi:hypothetical protein